MLRSVSDNEYWEKKKENMCTQILSTKNRLVTNLFACFQNTKQNMARIQEICKSPKKKNTTRKKKKKKSMSSR